MNKIKIIIASVLFALMISCGDNGTIDPNTNSNSLGALQVASPNWQDQTIYFVMTDRFYNGDTANDVQTETGVEAGTEGTQWNGGDLKGLTEKLPYIKSLGFTAIWITPPVENQAWDSSIPYGGYHGYWASCFTNVDPHYGTLEDYKTLVKTAHGMGIYVIQDIVCNHMGNYFSMSAPYGTLTVNSNGVSMYPKESFFSNSIAYYLQNGTNGMSNEINAFHWNPDITDWASWAQLTNYQSSSLDDINTENPVVLKKMKEWFNYWIENAGIDGVRMDTAKNVGKEFWKDFCFSDDANDPGMRAFAEDYLKNDFIMFGEVHTASGDENEDEMCGGFTMDESGNRIMDSVLYYPLYSAIMKVFQKEEKTAYIKDVFDNLETYYHPDAIDKLVTFIDNHDKPRFLAGATVTKTKLALMFIFTSRGIPCVYYGTEQGFIVPRATMFEDGYHGDGGEMEDKDYFDTSSDWYKFIKKLNLMRSKYEVLRKGDQEVVYWDDMGAGLLAYIRSYGDEKCLVVFNTSGSTKYANGIPSWTNTTIELVNILSKDGEETIITEADGHIYTTISGFSVKVLVPEGNYVRIAD